MLDLSSDSKWHEGTELSDIRRFGYRLDGEMTWERALKINFYQQQFKEVKNARDRIAEGLNRFYTLELK